MFVVSTIVKKLSNLKYSDMKNGSFICFERSSNTCIDVLENLKILHSTVNDVWITVRLVRLITPKWSRMWSFPGRLILSDFEFGPYQNSRSVET
jgi:hypothetical protein